MKDKKGYYISLCTISCIMFNILGKTITDKTSCPFWLDSLGTILMAYIGGPVCGAIVGLFHNLIYGIFAEGQFIYSIVGMVIGIVTGFYAKRKAFESPFRAMTLGMGLALICTVLSVPINILLYGGKTSNVWGDQVSHMFSHIGVQRYLSYVIGAFYVEFLDKFISIGLVYLLIQAHRRLRASGKLNKSSNKGSFSLILVTAILLAGSPVTAKAQTGSEENYDEYTQSVYGSAEGLLAGEANDIEQTKDGRIWIGTYAGLYSYDGARFKLYREADSIKNVNVLYVDEEGRLWVGTNDNGFTTLINGHVMNTMGETDGLPSSVVKAITCDTNGNYFIGTSNGISIVNLNSGVRIVKNFDGIKNTSHLAADHSGNVIAVTDSGDVFYFHNGEIVADPIDGHEGYTLRSAYFTENGQLYMGTVSGQVLEYRIENNRPIMEKVYNCPGMEYINTFYENDSSELFICSDSGVGYFDRKGRYHLINTPGFANCVDNMLVDYQGDLWFASSRLGLLKLSKSPFAELFPEAGVGSHVTNAVIRWNGLLCCGTDEGFIVIDESKRKEVQHDLTERLASVRVRGLSIDSENRLWVATTGAGIFCASQKGNKFIITEYTDKDGMPGNRFRNIIELKDGTIAAAGDGGVALLQNGKVIDTLTAEDGLENIKSLCLIERAGNLYIGSDGGGISIVQNGRILRTIKREDGLSSNVVMRICYDSTSEGLLVVTSNGLCYIDKEGKVRSLDRFSYSNNFDVICDENGTAWVTGSAGIYVAETASLIANADCEYDLLNAKRGLRNSLTANSWNYREGSVLYLCTDSGVVRVDRNKAEMSVGSYRMILDTVWADDMPYELSRIQTLILPSETQKLVFEPEILNYSLNDPFISYCLEGYDTEPKVILLSELDSIVYTNLDPGSYVFRLSVLDSRKEKVIETSTYAFTISKEMYQNWWFLLYVAVVTMMMVAWATWFITRLRIRKTLLRSNLELEFARKQLKMGQETILSIARAVDAKDSNTSEHSYRVSEYSLAIARRYGYAEDKCETLRQMALLHDIGKIGIPDAILNKPAKLTDEEYAIMKTHVLRGGEILKDFSLIENVNVGALYHHERYDGKGYCAGLKGEEIPIEARIIGIADAFDAMTANRVYRKKLDLNVVMEELKRCSGSQFDPKLVEIMLALIEEGEIDVEALYGRSKEGM